jgi:hypothetical protein
VEYWKARSLDEKGQPFRSSEDLAEHVCSVLERLMELDIREVLIGIDQPETAASTEIQPQK